MSEFDQALTIVHDALTQLQDRAPGTLSRASLDSLQQLACAARQSPVRRQPSLKAEAEPHSAAPEAPRNESAPERRLGLAARTRAALEAASTPPPPIAAKPSAPRQQEERPETHSIPLQPQGESLEPSPARCMDRLRERALVCVKCPHLAATRTQVVFGVGNSDAELMFVGEAPGADEDKQGEPFVGRAGQLLTKIIEAMGFKRSDVYIGNVLKCRPDTTPGESGNRKPRPEEMATCLPYLIEQIEIIQPKCLVALGATAMEGLLGKETPMRDLRGRWHDFKGIPLMPTYHPAYLLRNQSNSEKRKVWEDMLQVLELLGKPISAKQHGYFLPK